MSRSYKHSFIVTEKKRKRWWKRQASKAVRRTDVHDYGTYRKVYDSWNINEFRFVAWPMGRYDLRSLHKAVGK
jgi:hypothetical protein